MRRSPVVAVDGISLEIGEGECIGVVGESGCGKSTAGMAIMRLLANNGHISNGQVVFDGTDLASLDEKAMRGVRGNGIALIPQDPMTSLNPVTKIGAQVAEGFRIHRGVSKSEGLERALEVLKMVEMPNPEQRLTQYPHQLSGGLRQRAMIAMSLVCEPKLLIADEPTTALDVTIQAQILDILDGLRERLGMAIMLITHDMGVIAGRTDRVLVMYAGKKVEEATTETLFSEMRHPYTQSLLASVPRVDDLSGGRLASIPGLPPDLSTDLVGCRFAPRCMFATDECRTTEPELKEDSPGHVFACFHPVDGKSETFVTKASSKTALAEGSDRVPLLIIDHLVKDFPLKGEKLFSRGGPVVSAVANVNFEVGTGETFGLVGESGCGKTTIGRLIVGLEEPTSGTITFVNSKADGLKGGAAARAAALDRQMMFQDPYASLNPRKRVGEIIAEPLEIQGTGTRRTRAEQVLGILNEVGLASNVVERYPHEFSGGQRQRIGLARALALYPRMVIADEPVSALDVSIQAQILNLMQDLQEVHGLSYILISHDLAVVRYISHRIGVMYLGKLVEVGPSNEVFASPAHHYTQGLLDAVPVPDVAESRARRGNQVKGELPSAANPPSGCRFRTRCPAAQDRCAEEEPLFDQVSPGHLVACHFPLRQTVAIATKETAAS
jgi:oligopeptide/dipeptide ABC transporter ATP-binding protein